MNRFGWFLAVVTAAAVSVEAHPGHAPLSKGAAHFLSNPGHFLPMLILSVVMIGAAQLLRARSQRAGLRTAALAVAVAAFII